MWPPRGKQRGATISASDNFNPNQNQQQTPNTKPPPPFLFGYPKKKKVGRAEREKTKENDARQKKYTRTHDALPPTGTPSVVRFSLSHFSFFSLFLKRDIKKKYRDET